MAGQVVPDALHLVPETSSVLAGLRVESQMRLRSSCRIRRRSQLVPVDRAGNLGERYPVAGDNVDAGVSEVDLVAAHSSGISYR